ncbi:Arginine transport ATP-binding protein ArtM [subsurface metagenome]
MLTVPQFSKSYLKTEGTLCFPGFCISDAAIVVLSGGNGAGKTTFLDCVYRMCSNNLEIGCFYLRQMYEHLLFPYKPIWWNVCLWNIIEGNATTDQLKARAKEHLTKFGLDIDITRYPASLSGGEKHLVLVLQMMLSNHQLLLIDEPLTGVDAARIEVLWQLLKTLVLRHRKYVILTSHIPIPGMAAQTAISFAGFNRSKLKLSLVDGDSANLTEYPGSINENCGKNKN